MSPLDVLEADIVQHLGRLPSAEWKTVRRQLREERFAAGSVVLGQARISDQWFFLSSGIAASEQSAIDGGATIARFFEPTQFCTNLTSVWWREIGSDDLIAITDLEGVSFPDRIFREQYLRGHSVGEYIRLKAMESLLFAKDLVCAKTSSDTEVRYRFLEQRYSNVIGSAAQKDIARFIGMTPQGLSRFLKNRRKIGRVNPG